MTNITQHYCAKRFTARLSVTQFEHIKSMVNSSAYIRSLIEKDMEAWGVKHEQK